MAKRPYVKIYVDDFFGSFKVQKMDAECIGAYFLMLMYASQEENIDLPDDDEELAVITKLGKKFTKHSKNLKNCFVVENGRLVNKKLRKVLGQYERTVEGSKKAIAERWKKEDAEIDTNVLQTNSERNTNHKPITNNQEPNKEVAKATKKVFSLEDFRLLVQQAISTCTFTDKFTPEAQKHFLSWATTENKITSLRKIKTDLAKYFQKEINYLSKYAPNQIEFMLELAQRKSYIGYVENNLPEPQKPRPIVFKELYGGMDNGKQKPKVEEVRETDEEMLDRLLGKQDEKRS